MRSPLKHAITLAISVFVITLAGSAASVWRAGREEDGRRGERKATGAHLGSGARDLPERREDGCGER